MEKFVETDSPDEIPDFASEDEEHEFWSTHSLGPGMLDRMGPIPESELPLSTPRTKPVSFRVNEDVLDRLKGLAARRQVGYQTLVREFITERLYEEEQREQLKR